MRWFDRWSFLVTSAILFVVVNFPGEIKAFALSQQEVSINGLKAQWPTLATGIMALLAAYLTVTRMRADSDAQVEQMRTDGKDQERRHRELVGLAMVADCYRLERAKMHVDALCEYVAGDDIYRYNISDPSKITPAERDDVIKSLLHFSDRAEQLMENETIREALQSVRGHTAHAFSKLEYELSALDHRIADMQTANVLYQYIHFVDMHQISSLLRVYGGFLQKRFQDDLDLYRSLLPEKFLREALEMDEEAERAKPE